MGESEQRPRWSVKNIVSELETFLDQVGFPEMEKPDGFGESYSFPSDVSRLRWEELGNLQLRLGGWLSWGLRLQAKEETELQSFETVYDITLWARIAEEPGKHPVTKRTVTKDELRAKIINEDDRLTALTQALILRRAKVQRLKSQNQIFSEQLTRLSREQSRRESEARLLG